MSTPDDLRSWLARMPSAEHPTYDFAPARLLTEAPLDRASLQMLIDDEDAQIAFNALFLELTILWRDRDFAQYRAVVAGARVRFRDNPRFPSLEAQACSCSVDARVLRRGLDHAKTALANLPGRPGILHTFAALVASLADQDKAKDVWLSEAEDALEEVIRLNPTYAMYHATLARILLHQDRYREATDAVTQAIELEPSTGRHYALRVGDYQDIRTAISFGERADQLRQEHEAVTETVTNVRSEFEDMRTQVFALLGLLAAVVAFIVTGVQVARQQALADAAGLMALIASSILAVFAGFRLLFLDRAGDRRAYVVLTLAVSVTIGIWALAQWA